ncbi:hypothetical protein D3C71_1125220 [compost metagenome]
MQGNQVTEHRVGHSENLFNFLLCDLGLTVGLIGIRCVYEVIVDVVFQIVRLATTFNPIVFAIHSIVERDCHLFLVGLVDEVVLFDVRQRNTKNCETNSLNHCGLANAVSRSTRTLVNVLTENQRKCGVI